MSAENDALVRLVGLTHDATRHVSHRTSVVSPQCWLPQPSADDCPESVDHSARISQ